MQVLRAVVLLMSLVLVTLVLLPFQIVFHALNLPAARQLPGFYHRIALWLMGIRLHVRGAIQDSSPSFIIANHISWLDIPIISSTAPLSFVAKSEIANWPVIGWFAKLQNCIFVERENRLRVGQVSNQISERLSENAHIVLFAEGTSGNGNGILPFRSSLFSAVKPSKGGGQDVSHLNVKMQTLTMVYTHIHGMPVDRGFRPMIAWYGEMDMLSHAWTLLKAGPIDVHLMVSDPVDLNEFEDRKAVAAYAEEQVRRDFSLLQYHRDFGADQKQPMVEPAQLA